MMSVVGRYMWRFLTSRLGLATVLCGLLWTWHGYDKRQAVTAARDGYVQLFELTAANAALAALQQRLEAAAVANQELEQSVQVAAGDARRFAEELEAYERDTEINPECVVDADLLQLLRAN